MKITKEFQPIHIVIETKEDLHLFQNVFYSYIKRLPHSLWLSSSTHDKKIQDIYNFLDKPEVKF